MHCNGHCYLQKQMQQEQQREQDLADAFSKNDVAVCGHYFPALERESYQEYIFSLVAIVAWKTSLYQSMVDNKLLKPPIFS